MYTAKSSYHHHHQQISRAGHQFKLEVPNKIVCADLTEIGIGKVLEEYFAL